MGAGRVELPPKLGVYPREDGLIHAMPAYLADEDIAAVKWISAYFGNTKRGLPSISGLIIVNDAETGCPLAIMDAAEITAARTAAASGFCIQRLGPNGWRRVGIIGFGEQGRFHASFVANMNPDAAVVAYSPRGIRGYERPIEVAPSARAAVEGADIVITAAPLSRQPRPTVVTEWLRDKCLLLPIDFDASIAPAAVECADLFLVDDGEQYEIYRQKGLFRGWRNPDGVIADYDGVGGERSSGHFVCCNLGVGSLDAAFAAWVLNEAVRRDMGVRLAM
jgi:ornithine cyclodeaminase/alanine dehydrogenase